MKISFFYQFLQIGLLSGFHVKDISKWKSYINKRILNDELKLISVIYRQVYSKIIFRTDKFFLVT